MNGREWMSKREEENERTRSMDISRCSCDPNWRIPIFITRADRVRIGGIGGTKHIVDIGAFFGREEDVD
jgi:hypothetical protein